MMKKTTLTLLIACLSTAVSYGASTYIDTTFDEAGITLGDFSTTTNPTGLINDADNSANVDIIANLSSSGSTLNDPAGQHLEIRGNLNKRATQENGMDLLTQSYTRLIISFSYYFDNTNSTNDGRVLYSTSGDFSDEVLVGFYEASVVGATQWFEDTILLSDSQVTFSDTARVRFANANGGAFSDSFNIDDITVIGTVPEPSSALLMGLGSLALLRRRR